MSRVPLSAACCLVLAACGGSPTSNLVPPPPPPPNAVASVTINQVPQNAIEAGTAVQLSAEARNAHRMLERLGKEGMTQGVYGDAFVETKYISGQAYHRVRLGPIETDTEAQRALRDAKALGHKDARILRP